jgi:prepilin-type N-terminal cleavage/methylation domain-containing protein/prepilin-type processing-associated H-X9-DG protein
MRDNSIQKHRGFTLVELLVVIGVIALLISLLLPALNKARQASYRLQCMNNLRNVYFAFYYYTQDNNGMLPYGYLTNYDGSGSKNMSWDDLLLMGNYGNLYDRKLTYNEVCFWGTATASGVPFRVPKLRCPTDPVDGIYASLAYRISYGPNGNVFGYGDTTGEFGTPTRPKTFRLTSLPPDTFLMTENPNRPSPSDNRALGNGQGLIYNPQSQLPFIDYSSGSTRYRGLHGSQLNYLFADSHVESLDPRTTKGGGSMSSPKGGWTPSRD